MYIVRLLHDKGDEHLGTFEHADEANCLYWSIKSLYDYQQILDEYEGSTYLYISKQ